VFDWIWVPKKYKHTLWLLCGPAFPLNLLLWFGQGSVGNKWLGLVMGLVLAFLIVYELGSEREDCVLVLTSLVDPHVVLKRGDTIEGNGEWYVVTKNRKVRKGVLQLPVRHGDRRS